MKHPEIDAINNEFRIVSILTIVVLSGGVFFYHFFEKLSFVDSLYFCVITLTTVGYGDITPKTDAGKLFTATYVIAGVAIIAAFANLLIKRAVIKRHQHNTTKK
jgi:voltage-gated potassium channel